MNDDFMTFKRIRGPTFHIPSIGPSITQAEIDLVTEAVKDGWYDKRNLHLDQFVKEFSAFTGKRYCLPTSHGTAAIHLALIGLGVGPGDEVIVSDITWVACAAPVAYVGAKVVFADINEGNWCLSPESFEKAITRKTKAVIVVDILGTMPDMGAILAIARKHHIAVIEDAAEAIGAQYKGKPAGSFGDVGIFSFNATKLVIAGQGGAAVTDNRKVFERMKLYAHHGINKKPNARYYWSMALGFNYNWTNIQAALALAQLRRLRELVEKRRKIFRWYKQRLQNLKGVHFLKEVKGVRSTHWITTVMLDQKLGIKKETVERALKKHHIDARPFFYPISSMPPYARYTRGKDMRTINPVSYRISPYGVCLPSGANLTEVEVDYVCRMFKQVLQENSKS